MHSWQLSEDEKKRAVGSAKPLRLLWVYSAGNEWVLKRHTKLLGMMRHAGYHVTGLCSSFPEDGYRWYPFPEVEQMWRQHHPLLLGLYEKIAAEMSDHDVLILYNGANLHPDFVKQLPGIKAYTFGDPESWDKLAGPIGPAFDIHFANQPAMLEAFRKNGMPNAFFYPLGSQVFPEDIPLTRELVLDVNRRPVPASLFCGKTEWRSERLESLYSAFPKAYIKASGWPKGMASYQEIHDTYVCSQVGWNIHNTFGFNFRTYDLAAYGVMQLCDRREDLPWIFEEETEIIGYDDIQDCIEKTRYYLAHPNEQRQIALRAWERWQRDYTPLANWEYLAARIALNVASLETKAKQKQDEAGQVDLAGKTIGNPSIQQGLVFRLFSKLRAWKPYSYIGNVIGRLLFKAIDVASPAKVLEVGCGNSVWLPYLAQKRGLSVAGIDSSPKGCAAARQQLNGGGVCGDIYCMDMFHRIRLCLGNSTSSTHWA